MITTSDEIKYSTITKIAGQDEGNPLAADVIQRSDGKHALAVDSITNISNNLPLALDNRYRIDWSITETEYQASSQYQTIWSYSGSGYLHGFHFDFDTDKHQIKLIIDGSVIVQDISGKIMDVIGYKAAGAPPVLFGNRSGVSTSDNADFDFSPHADIRFLSSVVIQAKKNDDNAFKVKDYIVYISKFS